MAAIGSSGAESSGLVNTLQGHVDDIRSLIQCGICIRPLYEPFTLACGHTFCYSCLSSWFAGGRSKRTCPDCRAPVKTQPAPAYLVRAVVQMFTTRAELLDAEETTAEHSKNHKEEIEKLDNDKANTDPQSGGLFGGLFTPKPPQLKPVIDIDDGIMRCPNCSWELEDGQNCAGCGYVYRPDSEGTYSSGSDLSSESDYDSILDDDDEDEDEDGIDDPDAPTIQSRVGAPFHAYDRSISFGPIFPDLHTHPFYFPGLRPTGTGHHPWQARDHFDGNAPYDPYGEGEEEEEEDEDYYEESFIDDEEHTQREREGSESDHSTVVGSSRARNRPSSRGPPFVQYPQVFGPSSAAEPEDYDWESEDEESVPGRLPRRRYVVDSDDSDAESGETPDGNGSDDMLGGLEEDSDSDDSEGPHLSAGRSHFPPVIPASDDDEIEDGSSSPPRTRPSRNTGSSANNAIAVDDSDEEEPVGPVRRASQRRRARFSPY
ncbi:uncharacterized protein N7484_008522 [Penicillium longicatenatum]|uniref:uncharacterized protein n=1 Tax=Penicillium longicatenatum TaxID=1561947 RepID=UPI0025482D42|nr:uncharacterized protein N7484_008522 [Penicillium longicatenatum]KAJ5635209.1 hypothetical protein N7484_008522 [Penicillium longicatenatum]